MSHTVRYHSIDIMKGLLIMLMLFVYDLYLPSLPPWIAQETSGSVGLGLAGWVFPGFLFMLGMTIPFIVSKKINENLSSKEIIRYIFSRSIILLVIGVLMVNINRVDSQLTGFGKDILAILIIIGVFLSWNKYPEKENNFFTVAGLRFLGLAVFVFLIFRFRSGSFENGSSLITGWWEIPGLAGWGFLVSALTFLAFRNSVSGTFLIWLVFLGLNILSQLNLTEFLNPVRPYLGPLIDGNIPLIFLSGHISGLLLKKFSAGEYRKVISRFAIMSLIMIATGIGLRKWMFPEGIYGNPGISLICSGLTLAVFILIYRVADTGKNDRFFNFLKPAGINAFTTYLIPVLFYHIIAVAQLAVFFYHDSEYLFLSIAGSAIWALLMVWLTSLLVRLNIRLKI